MVKVFVTIFFMIFFQQANALENKENYASISEARTILKNYGLARCVASRFDEESELKSDISLSGGVYHFMGIGMHQIKQNEDTLETLHDPYRKTREFILSVYDSFESRIKHGNRALIFDTCLIIYNSAEFDEFIKSQDQYIQ